MTGIFGVIARPCSGEARASLAAMIEGRVASPYAATGTLVADELGVAVGWSVPRGGFSDCLPVWNETRDIALVFAGEDFPNEAVKSRVRTRHPDTTWDTAEYLLRLYEMDGRRFLEAINGWFSGVLIDWRSSTVLLFNDRYGLRRVYWHQDDAGFYFASEARSLLRLKPRLRRLDPRSLGELIACGCTLQDRSLFESIALLPGGACWSFTTGQPIRRESYFQRETWEKQSLLNADQYYEQLQETFARVLPGYLQGRQPAAVSLTGGLDGRMIMAWAGRPPGTLPCYTFGGPYRECGDVALARRVARLCGQPHEVITGTEEFLSQFPSLARRAIAASDGAMDITGSQELYVNQRARQVAPIRLTGNYGSEILRGSIAFRPRVIAPGLFDGGLDSQFALAQDTYTTERRGHPVSFIAFKQVPWYHYARFAMEQAELTPRSPFLDNALVALAYRAPREAILSKQPAFRLIDAGNPALSRVPTDRGLRYRPIPVLTAAQHLWQEFTFRAEYAYDDGMPQTLAKVDHCLAGLHLERLFLGRHKFAHFRVWYRDQLAAFVKEILLDPRTLSRPYLQRGAVERIVGLHTSGRGNYTSEIHTLLALELIQRELIENS